MHRRYSHGVGFPFSLHFSVFCEVKGFMVGLKCKSFYQPPKKSNPTAGRRPKTQLGTKNGWPLAHKYSSALWDTYSLWKCVSCGAASKWGGQEYYKPPPFTGDANSPLNVYRMALPPGHGGYEHNQTTQLCVCCC